MINKKRLIKLTQELIRIDSQNPPGDETRISCFIKKYLDKIGINAKIYEFKKKRGNIVAILKGRDTSRSLLITPHSDTVPAGRNWRINPFSAKIAGNKIYGLGATDCKGNLAVSLEVMKSIVEDGAVLGYNLIFAATADEESGSGLGLIPLLDKGILKPDAALVLDSDEFDIVITQKGLLHLKVKIQGKKAHGAYPWRGINAIDIAIGILGELKKHKFSYKKNKYLKAPTQNIGTIKGGDKVNVVADWCEFELDVRFLPGMSGEAVLREIRSIIRKHTKNIPQNAVKFEIEGAQSPYYIRTGHPLVQSLVKAARKLKIKSCIKGSEGATTITFFQNKNIPAVATGFGSSNCAHTANEFALITNLCKGAQMLEEFLKNYNFSD